MTTTIAEKIIAIDGATSFQAIDGFGTNINPARWNNGALKPALDLLTDELGATLFRFDCFGQADWLDPQFRQADGSWDAKHLEEVYTSPVFQDAWNTYRYLQNKPHTELFFNVSGRIPEAWARIEGNNRHLVDYRAYASMVVSMMKWAREKEGLEFRVVEPFNECDLAGVEGPAIDPKDYPVAILAVAEELQAQGLGDVQIIPMGDAKMDRNQLMPILADVRYKEQVFAFGGHFYGDGGDQEPGELWHLPTEAQWMVWSINNSAYNGCPFWITEYGDLDQTSEVEFAVAWRYTRRLLKLLRDSCSAAMTWDAYDNLHKHDDEWSQYGLLATTPDNHSYTPKTRFYACKQVFRYIKPGWQRVDIKDQARPGDENNPYAKWQAQRKHMPSQAFLSADGSDLTIIGLSRVEGTVPFTIDLSSCPNIPTNSTLRCIVTTREKTTEVIETASIIDGKATLHIPEGSIFTITTLAN